MNHFNYLKFSFMNLKLFINNSHVTEKNVTYLSNYAKIIN